MKYSIFIMDSLWRVIWPVWVLHAGAVLGRRLDFFDLGEGRICLSLQKLDWSLNFFGLHFFHKKLLEVRSRASVRTLVRLWLLVSTCPQTWASKFPLAAGSRQSPVDIKTNIAKSYTKAKALCLKYSLDKALRLINPGYGWMVQMDGEGSELSGGPLEGVYKLEQFHCHWGCSNDKGSEHTVDGQSYASELHLVHWNCSKYSSFKEAANHPDGLAVLGIFLKVGKEHQELGKVASLLHKVSYKGDSIAFPGEIDLNKFIPKDKGYWTYQGSLTTPPCSESVTWIIFKEPIEVSEQQLSLFRSLRCHGKDQNLSSSEGLIVTNVRPQLPLGNRELRECGSL